MTRLFREELIRKLSKRNTVSLFLHATLVVLAAAAASPNGHAASQACGTCGAISIPDTPVKVVASQNVNIASMPASTGMGKFKLTISQSPSGTPLPASLPAGTYQAWCGTTPSDAFGQAGDFTATTNLGSTNITSTILNQLN